MSTTTETIFDGAKAEAFGGRMMSILGGSLLNSMVDIGHRTGLFAAAAEGCATSDELAARAGLTERYAREWLGSVTTGGIVEYDEATEAFLLPPEHAALHTGCTSMGPIAVSNSVLAKHVTQIAQVFQQGGGVPYSAFAPECTAVMGAGPLRRHAGRGLSVAWPQPVSACSSGSGMYITLPLFIWVRSMPMTCSVTGPPAGVTVSTSPTLRRFRRAMVGPRTTTREPAWCSAQLGPSSADRAGDDRP